MELDWQVGELLKTLRELDAIENTIIIFTSDNGMVLNDGYNDRSVEMNTLAGHTPSGILRGGKYSRYDGGMHVPLIVQWNGMVQPGESDALICQVDFLASFARMLNMSLPDQKDSCDVFDALAGRSKQGRKDLVLEASRHLSYRSENWFLIPSYSSDKESELFDLSNDPSQKNNIASDHPEMVEQLKKQLDKIVADK